MIIINIKQLCYFKIFCPKYYALHLLKIKKIVIFYVPSFR